MAKAPRRGLIARILCTNDNFTYGHPFWYRADVRPEGTAVIRVSLGKFGRVDIASPTSLEVAALALVLVFIGIVLMAVWVRGALTLEEVTEESNLGNVVPLPVHGGLLHERS